MAIINQGDQYDLPVKILANNIPLTPGDVDDVRIQVGDCLKSYIDGDLGFDDETGNWLFPLTEDLTQSFENLLAPIQVGVKNGAEYMYSATQNVNIDKSIIKESWD